ncbi:MAG: GAF domain-containing protein [Candidatus Hydrogenedentota bacterium]|nr:MAG: GAF domain-containing protein [Candidatus Hydrogenedentota bacterium]
MSQLILQEQAKLEPNSLVAYEKNGYVVKLHPELMKASQYLLKAARSLLNNETAKLILITEGRKPKTLRLGGSPLTKLQKKLFDRCIKEKQAFLIRRGQNVYDEQNTLIGQAPEAFLYAPLLAPNNKLLGMLIFEGKQTWGDFTDADVALADAFSKTFARLIYASIADTENNHLMVRFTSNLVTLLENLYLYRNNLENNFLLAEMIKVSKMINSTLDLQSLLDSIMESAKVVLKAESSSLMLIDKKTNELYFNTIAGEKENDLKEIRIPMGKGIAGIVAQTRQPLIVNNAQEDPRVFKEADAKTNFVTRNLIAAPLMVRNRIIGVIEVINSIGREEFNESDLELFTTFAEQSALAIHNRELIDSLRNINQELKKKVHELSSIHEITKALISNLNEYDLYDSVVRIMADELVAERVSIMLYDESRDKLKIVSYSGLNLKNEEDYYVSLDSSLAGLAFREQKVIHTNNLEESPYAGFRDYDRYLTGACIIHPLMAGNDIYGVINIAERSDGTGFTEDDYRLVATISGQIAKGIQNFRLLDEMIQKKAYEKELEITSSIQKSILPSKKLESPYFDMGIISVPAKMMGGDFYDYKQYSEEEFSFLVADVSGKSLPAALFMAVTNSIIRTIARVEIPPQQVLYEANDLVFQNSKSGMFVTLFYALYNARTRLLQYASAGHNEQLIFRSDTHEFEMMHAKGSPLGVIPSELHGEFGTGKAYLAPGDMLILYTDGVVEAINERKEEYGLQRLKDLIADQSLEEADQIVKRVYRDVSKFAGNEPQFDDFTLMILKIAP